MIIFQKIFPKLKKVIDSEAPSQRKGQTIGSDYCKACELESVPLAGNFLALKFHRIHLTYLLKQFT